MSAPPRPVPRSAARTARAAEIARCSARAEAMVTLFRTGMGQRDIAAAFGVSRSRVGQILKHRCGLTGADGGITRRRAAARAEAAEAAALRKEAAHLAAHGCTIVQMAEARATAKACGLRATPLGLYATQKGNAKEKGVAWEIGFWDWWSIWVDSGKLGLRGRGQGYTMYRKNNQGPFSPGNVVIGLSVDNSVRKKRSGLPLGVKAEGRNFVATRMLHGKTRHLGTFPTPEAAAAAYAALAPIEPPDRHPSPSRGTA